MILLYCLDLALKQNLQCLIAKNLITKPQNVRIPTRQWKLHCFKDNLVQPSWAPNSLPFDATRSTITLCHLTYVVSKVNPDKLDKKSIILKLKSKVLTTFVHIDPNRPTWSFHHHRTTLIIYSNLQRQGHSNSYWGSSSTVHPVPT